MVERVSCLRALEVVERVSCLRALEVVERESCLRALEPVERGSCLTMKDLTDGARHTFGRHCLKENDL